jgi:bifunctional oligoribonuclease and PAP phosphatase NrnA
LNEAASMTDAVSLDVPQQRREPLRELLIALRAHERVVLTTHVNADGDGAGSEAALAAWLIANGQQAAIVNPTAFPEAFRFLLPADVAVLTAGTDEANAALAAADAIVVLDTAEPRRIGKVAGAIAGRPVFVLDHHVAASHDFDGPGLRDPDACATGELVFDLLRMAGWPAPWPTAAREGLYTAIVTDTGSFRYANTTPRAHAIAGELIRHGVDPESMYRRIYGTVPLRRARLLRHALDSLDADPDWPITSVAVDRRAMADVAASAEDVEGLVEYARSIEGTEVAILFREVPDGSTKISLRSNGALDVNAIARTFGGGGHVKASGAVIGEPIAAARERVLAAVKTALQQEGLDFRDAPAAS